MPRQPCPPIRVRPATLATIRQIARRHHLSLIDTIHILTKSWDHLTPEQKSDVLQRHNGPDSNHASS